MFGSAEFDQMPESFRTDPAVWDGFIGRVWQAVLAPLALPRDATLIEIGPGSSAKLGHALALSGFHGTLYVVEAHAGALAQVRETYAGLLPQARLVPLALPLDAARATLPRQADALIGNHVLDDFLLYAAARDHSTFDWAMRYSDDVAAATHEAWARLCAHHGQPAAAAGALAHDMATTLKDLAPRHIVLSQYPSSTLAAHGLDVLNARALDVLDTLSALLPPHYSVQDCMAALSRLPHYNNAHIGQHVLNPRYWMVQTWNR